MTIHLFDFNSEIDEFPQNLQLEIENAAIKTLETLFPSQRHGVSVLVCDNQYIQELNRTYRGVDKPTDVLSFSDEYVIPETDVINLGDIAISYPMAMQQSLSAGYAVENELRLLVVHGVLHLCGFDHVDDSDKVKMWALQEKILRELGNVPESIPK
jgi:probable rRNA maturation factor